MIGHDPKPFRSKVSQGSDRAGTQPPLATVSVDAVTTSVLSCGSGYIICQIEKSLLQTSVEPGVCRMQPLTFAARLLRARIAATLHALQACLLN